MIAIQRQGSSESLADKWEKAVGAVRDPNKEPGVEELAPGSWLITSEAGLPLLGRAISQAQQDKLPYNVLFVEEGLHWRGGS